MSERTTNELKDLKDQAKQEAQVAQDAAKEAAERVREEVREQVREQAAKKTDAPADSGSPKAQEAQEDDFEWGSPDQIEAHLAATRDELGQTVDALAATLHPKHQLQVAKQSVQKTVQDGLNGDKTALQKLGIVGGIAALGVGLLIRTLVQKKHK